MLVSDMRGNSVISSRVLSSIDHNNPNKVFEQESISALISSDKVPISKSQFMTFLDKSLKENRSLDKVAFWFLSQDLKDDPQGDFYFSYMAEWLRPQLTKNDSSLWQSFAKEWIKTDKERVRDYLDDELQVGGTAQTDEFSELLRTALMLSDVQENYAPFLTRMLSASPAEIDYFTASTVLEEAYRANALGLRAEIITAIPHLSPQVSEDYLSAFYANLWESEEENASKLVDEIIHGNNLQSSEIQILLNTGYLKNPKTFLDWFRDYAPKTLDTSLAQGFYNAYESISDRDRLWLRQSRDFKTFEEGYFRKTIKLTNAQ